MQEEEKGTDLFIAVTDGDFLYYLENLREWKDAYGCRIYAYCLMANHVHLIIDPGEDERNLAGLMKRVAGRHTRYVNRLERRVEFRGPGRPRKVENKSVPFFSSGY